MNLQQFFSKQGYDISEKAGTEVRYASFTIIIYTMGSVK